MSIYDSLAANAHALLVSKGRSMSLIRASAGSYDPNTATVSALNTTHTVFGVTLNYAVRDVDGTKIQRGDVRVLISPSCESPRVGDTLLIGSERFVVVDVRAESPAGVVLMYEVQARGGA